MIPKMWKVEAGGATHWLFAENYSQVKALMKEAHEEQLGAGSIDFQEAQEEMQIYELKHDDEFKYTTVSGHTFDFTVRTWIDFFYAFTTHERKPMYFACSEW